MNPVLRIPLHVEPEQVQRLQALQTGFARVCNALAPLVQQTKVWNRVALHHLAYRQLREQFPGDGLADGVQRDLLCLAHRAAGVPAPPKPVQSGAAGDKPLPLLRFADSCPVYFDRHTLSLKAGQLSMFTLDGRMRFQLALAAQDEERFHAQKLREIVLSRRRDGVYELAFCWWMHSRAPLVRKRPMSIARLVKFPNTSWLKRLHESEAKTVRVARGHRFVAALFCAFRLVQPGVQPVGAGAVGLHAGGV